MARTTDEIIKSLPIHQQREIEARSKVLLEEEKTLRELRKAHELTQERVAEALHISQDGVSRIEKRSDFLLSTLRSYVEAMGGKLRLVAEFPNRKPVTLTGINSLSSGLSKRGRKSMDEVLVQGLPTTTSPGCPGGTRSGVASGVASIM